MLSDRLFALRTARRLSQYEVARSLLISRSAYSSYETGRRSPSPDILIRIATFFRTTTDYLLGSTDDPLLPPALDARSRSLLENYLHMDARGRDLLYRISVQEKLQYLYKKEEEPPE